VNGEDLQPDDLMALWMSCFAGFPEIALQL
jgi:hypothetical protein